MRTVASAVRRAEGVVLPCTHRAWAQIDREKTPFFTVFYRVLTVENAVFAISRNHGFLKDLAEFGEKRVCSKLARTTF